MREEFAQRLNAQLHAYALGERNVTPVSTAALICDREASLMASARGMSGVVSGVRARF